MSATLAPAFSLPDTQGATHGPQPDRVTVVVFTCNHCPTAQAYESRIMKLHADYKDKGVALVAISNSPVI